MQDLAQTWKTRTRNPTEVRQACQQEQEVENKIKKEIEKLKFYLEEGEELFEDSLQQDCTYVQANR